MSQQPNLDSFRINVFLESMSSKLNKKYIYAVLGTYITVGMLWIGLTWAQVAMRSALIVFLVLAFFCSSTGKAAATRVTRWIPWSKFGYISVKIIGCEAVATDTPAHLFLHKNSKVGQITEWIRYKANAPGKVIAVWAGRMLKDEDELSSVGIMNGNSLVVMFGESRNESLRRHQKKSAATPKVVKGTPGQPDMNFNYEEDEESVPQFIHDMFSDDEDEDENTALFVPTTNLVGRWSSFRVWLSKIGQEISTNVRQEFGDSPWVNVVSTSPQLRAPVQQPVLEEADASDTEEDDETPSFLREMLSDSDDDDEPETVATWRAPDIRLYLWTSKKMIMRRVRRLLNGMKVKVFPSSTKLKVSQAKDVITLTEDEDEVRYTMPCGVYHHAMSQSSLLEYARNQVLTEKNEEIGCPVPGCMGAHWTFEDVCEILRAQNASGFELPEADVRKMEQELSANFIGKRMNCQRCPQCEVALMRLEDDETKSFDHTCFQCDASFCWGCRAPWSAEFDCCMNPKCTTTWKFVAAQMLKNCPRKRLDHMNDVPTLRACPECGQLITHVTACKHMRCSLCTTRFCFICMLPQKDGNWQCGYDAQSCKLAEVQSVDVLTYGSVARTNILERVLNDEFKQFKQMNMDTFHKAQEQFVADVMASVRNPQFFD